MSRPGLWGRDRRDQCLRTQPALRTAVRKSSSPSHEAHKIVLVPAGGSDSTIGNNFSGEAKPGGSTLINALHATIDIRAEGASRTSRNGFLSSRRHWRPVNLRKFRTTRRQCMDSQAWLRRDPMRQPMVEMVHQRHGPPGPDRHATPVRVPGPCRRSRDRIGKLFRTCSYGSVTDGGTIPLGRSLPGQPEAGRTRATCSWT